MEAEQPDWNLCSYELVSHSSSTLQTQSPWLWLGASRANTGLRWVGGLLHFGWVLDRFPSVKVRKMRSPREGRQVP